MKDYHYRVKRLPEDQETPISWDAPGWRDIPAAVLTCYMGEKPSHFPKTAVKLAYGKTALSGIFRVEDQYVLAVATHNQQSVCRDSCVEFFFSPAPDSDQGYFNFEVNCGGIFLFHFHPLSTREDFVELPETLCNKVDCRPSLLQIVNPEIGDSTIWTVSFRIPFDILEKFCRSTIPGPGSVWCCNFYKCADATSHPHWLTWAPVDVPKPDFHRPEFFGTLLFE